MTEKRNVKFGQLLSGMIGAVAKFEGKKIEVIREEIGLEVGLSASTIERYQAGLLPTEFGITEKFAFETFT